MSRRHLAKRIDVLAGSQTDGKAQVTAREKAPGRGTDTWCEWVILKLYTSQTDTSRQGGLLHPSTEIDTSSNIIKAPPLKLIQNPYPIFALRDFGLLYWLTNT